MPVFDVTRYARLRVTHAWTRYVARMYGIRVNRFGTVPYRTVQYWAWFSIYVPGYLGTYVLSHLGTYARLLGT